MRFAASRKSVMIAVSSWLRSVETFGQVTQGFKRIRGDTARQHIRVEKVIIEGGGNAVIGAQVDRGSADG
jgi:hypothetical protein